MKRTLPLLAVAVMLLTTACRPSEEDPDTLADPAGVPPADPMMAAPATPAPDAEARTVHVVLSEWRVAPGETTLAPGRVTFHVMNEGQRGHRLTVSRPGMENTTELIPAGGTATLTLDLTPGTYTLSCPVVDAQGDHRQMGMQTTIRVQ